jgi:hypothetical protein
MARQACACACVGTANAPSNHARVAAENPSSAAALLTGSVLPGTPGPSAAILQVCIHPPTVRSTAAQPLRAAAP